MIEPSQRSNWRAGDPAMLIITLVLIGFGLLTIYSAAPVEGLNPRTVVLKQALFTLIGLGMMAAFAAADYRFLRSLATPLYAVALFLLAVVLKKGVIIGGAQRWFDLKIMSFQPSEAAKLATIIALATFISSRGARMRGLLAFVATVPLIALPALLVFKEPDLGTALVFLAIWCGMITVARTRGIYLLGSVLVAIPAFWVAWNGIAWHGRSLREPLFHDYQKDRLRVFLHPEDHFQEGGYNIVNAKITIGQAGLFGHRLADAARVNEDQRLVVTTTDFAFAHATGNFGFIGALALFALFLLLIWRYLRVARLARDEFGQLIAFGAVAVLFFQAFVNIGMNVNMLPVVGIPLPFISGGGTPMVMMLLTQGILQSILIHRQKLAFGKR